MPKVGPLILLLIQSRSSVAVATSFAMGFSARTCFPAERAFLMYSGWTRMGRLKFISAVVLYEIDTPSYQDMQIHREIHI